MAKDTRKNKTVVTLTHGADKRKNIPTAEFQSVQKPDEQKPVEMRYPRNTDLDPQLVWRGKDEQDWSDLVVHAPPIYIQEKVHPKVLIDDLLAQTRAARAQEPGHQPDLFADFNGIPQGAMERLVSGCSACNQQFRRSGKRFHTVYHLFQYV